MACSLELSMVSKLKGKKSKAFLFSSRNSFSLKFLVSSTLEFEQYYFTPFPSPVLLFLIGTPNHNFGKNLGYSKSCE
jgi:hypothetical protein